MSSDMRLVWSLVIKSHFQMQINIFYTQKEMSSRVTSAELTSRHK